MSNIKQAVINCRQEIAKTQAILRAFQYVENFINTRKYNGTKEDYIDNACHIINAFLYRELCTRWEQLDFLGPVSPEVQELLKEKAISWFKDKDTEIMSWVGNRGSYFVTDEETFRKELQIALGIENE